MPEIGRPEAPNPFNKVEMAPQKKSNESETDILNRIANNGHTTKGSVKYVDRKLHNQMGKEEFMKLLTYQLANQDPTAPVDNKKFSAEMAQFAQLEQLANLNSKMDQMGKNAPAENKFYGASFIGKEITTSGTSVSFDGSTTSNEIPFYLSQNAKSVSVSLYDKQNQLVGRVEMENLKKGNQIATWDGMSLNGQMAAKGDYRIDVRAFGEDFTPFIGETKTTGVVNGVTFENGETILQVDGNKKIFLRDVDSFRQVKPMKEAIGQYNKNQEMAQSL